MASILSLPWTVPAHIGDPGVLLFPSIEGSLFGCGSSLACFFRIVV